MWASRIDCWTLTYTIPSLIIYHGEYKMTRILNLQVVTTCFNKTSTKPSKLKKQNEQFAGYAMEKCRHRRFYAFLGMTPILLSGLLDPKQFPQVPLFLLWIFLFTKHASEIGYQKTKYPPHPLLLSATKNGPQMLLWHGRSSCWFSNKEMVQIRLVSQQQNMLVA